MNNLLFIYKMEVTGNQLIDLLTKEMESLKIKILDTSSYASYYYKDWDIEHDYDTWNKKANDSMRYQRIYIATKYTKTILIEKYPESQKFDAFTSDMKKLIAATVNYYGLEEGKKVRVSWDFTDN